MLKEVSFVLAQEKFKQRDNKDRKEFAGTIVCIGCQLQQQDGGAWVGREAICQHAACSTGADDDVVKDLQENEQLLFHEDFCFSVPNITLNYSLHL